MTHSLFLAQIDTHTRTQQNTYTHKQTLNISVLHISCSILNLSNLTPSIIVLPYLKNAEKTLYGELYTWPYFPQTNRKNKKFPLKFV